MKHFPRQSPPQERKFMQLIVGPSWVPEVYTMHARRQFGAELVTRLEPFEHAKLGAKVVKKVVMRRKNAIDNPCLVQLKTFAI